MYLKVYLFIFILASSSLLNATAVEKNDVDKPKWFESDTKSSAGWDFYCEGSGDSEEIAKKVANSLCSQKICMLFGVEVSSVIETNETLKGTDLKSTVIEKCPNVQVRGRVEKRSSASCEDSVCQAYVHQYYPNKEYQIEFERLNKPALIKEFEKTIIIREGNKEFKDPSKCKSDLRKYSELKGESPETISMRIDVTSSAKENCKDLDDRSVSLQDELNSFLSRSWSHRKASEAALASLILTSGVALPQKLSQLNQLEKSIQIARTFDIELKKLGEKYFDWIFNRSSYVQGQGWILLNGKIINEPPTAQEAKNCQKHSELLAEWPVSAISEINVCVPGVKSEKTCEVFSRIRVEDSYLNCVCNLASKLPDCVKVLRLFVVDHCSAILDKKCLLQLKKKAADYMQNF